jgi:hypothetical protein
VLLILAKLLFLHRWQSNSQVIVIEAILMCIYLMVKHNYSGQIYKFMAYEGIKLKLPVLIVKLEQAITYHPDYLVVIIVGN